MTWRVLVTCPHLQRALGSHAAWLSEHDIVVDAPALQQQLSEAELLDIIHVYDGVVAGDDPFTAAVLERGARLKVVAKWGIGLDAIDQEAAARLGIRVSNTPGAFGDEVADVAVGYLVMLARQLHRIDREVRAGRWPKPTGISLASKTLGVVGLGSIGSALVQRARAMGMHVVGCDPRGAPALCAEAGVGATDLEAMLRHADFVALCCSLTPENHHMIDAGALAMMKPGSMLINVSRGALVDTEALLDALARGHLAGAALDVFEREPPPSESALVGRDDVILGSHNASNTREAVARVNERALHNLLAGLQEPLR